MALTKRQYTDGQTIITAANLNDIQDHLIDVENSYVPKTRTVAGKALSSNITLAASDVGAVPTSRTVNSKALSSNITLNASDIPNNSDVTGTNIDDALETLNGALDVGITLRTAVGSAANFNEIKQAGVYFVAYRTNYVNAPATWGTLVVYQPSSSSSTVVQEFYQHSRKWTRYYTENTWYAWREVMLDVTPITSITTASNIITLNEGFTWVEGRALVWGKVCQIYIDIKSGTNIASGTTTIGTLPSALAPATSSPLTKLYISPSGITGGRIQASDRSVKIYGSVSANTEVGIAGTFLLA